MPEAHAARPSWDEYFMGLTQEVAKRATCDRGRSGCIVVKQKRIVATGYVGSPPGLPHCGHLTVPSGQRSSTMNCGQCSKSAKYRIASRRVACSLMVQG